MSSSGDSIHQIDALQLPKRFDNRRQVYVGEGIQCQIKVREQKYAASVVDMSFHGIAVVLTEAKKSLDSTLKNELATLYFSHDKTEESFTCQVKIANVSHTQIRQQTYLRLGLRFTPQESSFPKNWKDSTIPCGQIISPQVSCLDPFFYNEVILMSIKGCWPRGMELGLSSQCKSLFPGQKLNLQVFIPGRGSFIVTGLLGPAGKQAQKDEISVPCEFINPPQDFLAAISEYLLMYAPQPLTSGPFLKSLREKGFVVGNVSHALSLSSESLASLQPKDLKLNPSVFAFPIRDPAQEWEPIPGSRYLHCKMGSQLMATAAIHFAGKGAQDSLLKNLGWELPTALAKSPSAELVNFYLAQDASLIDLLIPYFQHVVRICAQNHCEYLLLLAQEAILPMLKKIGFESYKNNRHKQDKRGELVYLYIPKILSNQTRSLAPAVWDKIYKKLYLYLGKNPEIKSYLGMVKTKKPI